MPLLIFTSEASRPILPSQQAFDLQRLVLTRKHHATLSEIQREFGGMILSLSPDVSLCTVGFQPHQLFRLMEPICSSLNAIICYPNIVQQ